MIKWILTKIVGTKNQREVRRLRPIVEQIVSIEESWNGKGQEFLLEKTREWQGYLHRFLPMDLPPVRIVEAAPREELEEIAAKLNARFESLKEEFASLPTVEATPASIEEGKAAWNNITPQFDKLRERYLNQILPEAFAAVKHGARLLCGEERDICGQKQVWDMVHFDVQLLGGIALHRGYIAEMATGEGKTLVATLPVYLNALTGMGVHVVTVNDYLARRDSEWMGMLFQFLGLTVGCIQSMMPSQLRREQYACDITYGTNAEFGFDYLRDNGMATSKSEQVQRGHYFSIVDEVDSILIDEARTPLIISGPAVVTREQQYDTLRPAIERVVKAQTDLCNELMAQALKAQEEGRTEEVGRCLFKVKMGQPRHRAFLRAMQDPGASQFFISFEDDLMRNFGAAERMTKMMERLGVADGEALEHSFLNKSVESAQKRVEQRNYMWRKHVLDYDDVMNKQREIVYGYRNEVLSTENPREMIYDILEEVIATRAHEFLDPDAEGVTHPDELLAWMNASFPLGLTAEAAKLEERPIDDTIAFLTDKVKATYEDKASRERPEYLDHMERQIILGAIDKMWQEHLYNMDSLREGVRLRAQGQKDPLVEYKSEAYDLFITLMESIKGEAISNLFKSTTNLDAFEDFLASLPQFESSDENQEGGTSLPEIGFDGMPSDLLSALREQVSRAREQQAAQQAEPEQAPAVISDATTIGEGYKPAVAEPKLVMPKRKVSVVLRREEAPQAPAETPSSGDGEKTAVTLDSQDFAETMDNRDSADTRTF